MRWERSFSGLEEEIVEIGGRPDKTTLNWSHKTLKKLLKMSYDRRLIAKFDTNTLKTVELRV